MTINGTHIATSARFVFTLSIAVLVMGFGVSKPAFAKLETVDFTEHGLGAFDPTFFASSGVVFTKGSFVGFIQGDEALIGEVSSSVAGRFLTPVTGLSVSVALGVQAVVDLSLSVYDASSVKIDSTIFRLNQDLADPDFMGFGFFKINLPAISANASSFALTSEFVSGPNGPPEFGINTLVFAPVPEPGTIFSLSAGLLAVIAFSRRKRVTFRLPRAYPDLVL